MIAWHGKRDVRANTIARARTAIDGGIFRPQGTGDNGSGPLEALTGASDAQSFVAKCGYPEALAQLLCLVIENLPRDQAGQAALAWLEAAEAGADLTHTAEGVLLDALAEPGFAASLSAQPDAEAMLRRMIEMHVAELSATPASAADWRTVRKAAIALIKEAPVERQNALRLIETVAWPISKAPELLTALLWAEMEVRQDAIMVTRDLPPARPDEDDFIERVYKEQIAAGLDREAAYAAVERVMNEQRPDFLVRRDAINAVMEEASEGAATAMSARVVRRLRAAPVAVPA